jgi:hypothetical protein
MITLALVCAGFARMQLAPAETLRCGSVLIEPGDDAMSVLEKCVEPTSTITIMQPPLVSGVNTNVYQIGLAPQRWRIAREWGKFRAVVAIGADGRVEDIEFERRRD